jgi:hypothetical protein
VRSSHYWWQANFIASRMITQKLSLAGRVEYFSDPDKIMLNSLNTIGFSGASGGLCLNYKFTEKSLFRLERRHFFTTENQFQKNTATVSNQMTWLIGNITIWF